MINQAATHDNGPDQATPEVFIVEDEEIARRALTSLLTSYGYKAEAYESAEEALAHLAEHASPPVMLIDVDLPGMSGLQLVEKLRSIDPAFRAVLITAAESERIARFQRKHDVDYLRKPLDIHRLVDLLESMRDQDTWKH